MRSRVTFCVKQYKIYGMLYDSFSYAEFAFQPYLGEPYPYPAFLLNAPSVAVPGKITCKTQTVPAVRENVQFAVNVMFS